MAVPKKRTSKSVRNMRRAHDFLVPKFSRVCSNCGELSKWHHVCQACGFYRGKKVLEIKSSTQTSA